jgi:elongator complex protein 3
MNQPVDGRRNAYPSPPPRIDFAALPERVDGRFDANPYNSIVSGFLKSHGGAELEGDDGDSAWAELMEAQRRNERSFSRCVGLSVETRPDLVSEAELERIRRIGATKVQIGFQSLSDEVLRLNKRGHDVAATRKATRLLRQAGFKIQAHWMPNLYGSSPARDVEDFEKMFSDPDFRPDELKIYPCSLVESAELMVPFEEGKWRPYAHEELVEVLTECLKRVPTYCRVSRVIRDIPGEDILVGNKLTNFRMIAQAEIDKRGWTCRDIRSREIRGQSVRVEELVLEEVRYVTSAGEDFFLQFVTPTDRIVGFLRLCLPSREPFIDELRRSALIREVHVYGAAVEIGKKAEEKSQHVGLGTRLIRYAEELSRRAGFRNLAVISSVGTREYYRRLGFRDGDLYQHLPIETSRESKTALPSAT